MAIDWLAAEMVFIPPPPIALCPACGQSGAIIVRSHRENDGSVTRRSICRHCSTPYLVVVDPDLLPATGKNDLGD